MGLFIVSKLLLMTLLFQLSEENEEWKTGTTPDPDKSVHLREFCLRVPDGSHWTRPPAKSAEPTKPAAPLLEQPTTEPEPTFWDSTQEPDLTDIQDTPDTPDTPDTRDVVVRSVVASGLRGLKTAISGCRCKEREKKPLTEILGFRSIMMWLPSETCESTEYIGTLTTGMEVCGIIPSLLTFVKEQLKSQSVPAAPPSIHEEPAVTPPAPLAPTTELPTTTVSPSLSEVTETDWIYEFEASGTETADECESCNFMTNLDNVDPKSVQSLTVRMQSFPCAVQIFLKDGTDFCLDLNHPEFKTALRKLGFSPPLEPDIARTPKPITSGCRCKESEKKLPAKLSTLTSTRVWPPSETCASTEFIETLMDGREVCVFTPSLSIYLHHLRPLSDVSRFLADTSVDDNTQPFPGWQPENSKIGFEYDYTFGVQTEIGYSVVEHNNRPAFGSAVLPGVMAPQRCMGCAIEPIMNIDQKDVQSLQMIVQPQCPVFIDVTLKNGDRVCVDLFQPWFITLLEKLEIQAH